MTANIASKPLTKVAWSLLLSNQSGDILEFEHRGQYPEVYHLNLELSRAFHRLSEQRQRRPIADHRWSSWQGGITLRMTHLDLPPFQNSSNIPQTAILSSQEHLLSESRLLHNCSISCEQTVWHTGTGRGDRESAGNILWHERLIPRLVDTLFSRKPFEHYLPAGIKTPAKSRTSLQADPAFASGASLLPSPSSHVLPSWLSRS